MVMQKLGSSGSSKILKVFLGLFLFGAMMGLVMTDIGGFFRSGTLRTDVASVGNETISGPQFSKTYQRRMEQSGITPDIAQKMGLPNMVLQQEIEREVLLQASKQNGVRIDDAYIANQLKQQLDAINMIGTPAEKLQRVLMQQQITEKQLVDLLRGDFTINVLASAVTTGDMVVPEELTLSLFRNEKEKRDADVIVIEQAGIKAKAPTDKEVAAFFKEKKENYRVDETRDIAVLILPSALFVKDVAVDAKDVETYYNDHKDQFMSAERVRVEQVITPTEDAAKAIMKDQPKSLESYKSDKNQFIQMDWYNKDGMPQELAKPLYTDKIKGLREPVRTSLGWHVMLVERYEEPAPKSFASVKELITRLLKDEQLDAHMSEITNELDAMVSEGVPLDEIADKMKLKTVHIAGLNAANAQKKLETASIAKGALPRVQEAAFTLNSDEVSPLMDVADGDYAMVQVTKLVPSAIPELAAIKASVTEDAAQAARGKALQDHADALVATFTPKDGGKFDKAVKEKGHTAQAVSGLTKADAEKRFSKEFSTLLFTLTPDNPLSYTQEIGKITLVRLKKVTANTETPSKDTLKELHETLRNAMLQEIQQQFILAWENKLGVSVNHQLLQSMFTATDEQ